MSAQAAVDLDTYNLSLLTAKEDILNPRSSTNWALFSYEGISNKLKLADSGAGGVAELAGKFHVAKPQYGLCRVATETGGPCIAMISWMGQKVDDYRRVECSSHVSAIKNFFKESHVFIAAATVEQVTEELITVEHSKFQARAPLERVRRTSRSTEKEETVGTNYRKTNAAMEMRRINRDSFWARAEREEEQRKEEERRRVLEDRRRLERERVQNERREADERDRKMNEKLQMIEEQRRKQAQKEGELRGQEKARWQMQQQSEHEEDMRARLKRSESIEMAAEAAALVSQRSMNPREFFRQLSSSSKSPLSPTSPRTGKPPLRRYQRSLTDTAFIFSRTSEDSSPLSPPFGSSPFSRSPASPFFRTASTASATTSPPTSPGDFRPFPSPQRPRATMMSPPLSPSPAHPASGPPASALPGLPSPGTTTHHPHHPQQQLRRHSASEEPDMMAAASSSPPAPPLEPSAPPASLLAFDALPGALVLPPSPPATPPRAQAQVFSPAPDTPPQPFFLEVDAVPQAPTAPLPVSPQANKDLHTASPLHAELDSGYIAHAVLVEEEEDEDEEEEEKEEEEEVKKVEEEPEPEPQAIRASPPVLQPAAAEQREEPRAQEPETEPEPEPESAVEEPVATEQAEEEGLAATEEEEEEDGQENDQSECTPSLEEPITTEQGFADAETNCEHVTQASVIVSTNGFTNGDTVEENGTERSLSPADSEPKAVCFKHEAVTRDYIEVEEEEEEKEKEEEEREEEEEEEEEEEVEISENGQEDIMERQMCVRALYDYQAEDESEISFEPGDIISDVETVDKAWWRGCSKDGRQGLFPANYVETI